MSRNININIKQFAMEFQKEYNFLYDHNDRVAGYKEAVDWTEEFMNQHIEFVAEFADYRGDFLTSDREFAAFAFAMEKYM